MYAPHAPGKDVTTMRHRPILDRSTDRWGDLAIQLISGAGIVLAPVNHWLLWHICKWCSRLAPMQWVTVALSHDSQMRVPLDDPYWSRIVAASYTYEEDFAVILRRFSDLDYFFVDCGANFGYWSIVASSEDYGRRGVLAIEAFPRTYEWLLMNCELNRSRFACMNAAVGYRTGDEAKIIMQTDHAGAHRSDVASNGVVVHTVAIDDAIRTHLGDLPPRIIVKLDIEGEEVNALRGLSRTTSECEVLLYYEDHARDADSEATRAVLGLGFNVYFAETPTRLIRIPSAHAASDVKKHKARGYNFYACQPGSSFGLVLDRLVTHGF